MKSINRSKPPKLIALLVGVALLGLVSQSALAACTAGENCTAAGSTISNMATLTYAVGGVTQPIVESSPAGNSTVGAGAGAQTTFLVDYKVNLLVTGSGALVNVTPGEIAATTALAGAYTTFTVTNLSNTSQDFALTAADATIATAFSSPATSNDAFDSTGLTIYVGATLAGATATNKITALAAGSSINVYVASAIPVAATNGQQDMISLQAQAIWPAALPAWAPAATANGNTLAVAGAAIVATTLTQANNAGTTVDIVFADAASAPAGLSDAARDGKSAAYNGYAIASAALSITKTVTLVCDPFNGGGAGTFPKNIPGAYVQYAITIANTGAASATLTSISDTFLAAGTLVLDPKLITGAGAGAACAATGTSQAGAGVGFGAVRGAGVGPGYLFPGPGTAADAVTAGASIAANVITIDFATLAGTAYGSAAPILATGNYVTVFYNAVVQ